MYFINGGSEGISFEDSSIKYSHNINENVSLNVSVGYSTSFSEESKPVSVSVGDDSVISATADPFSVSIDSVSVVIKIKFYLCIMGHILKTYNMTHVKKYYE